MRAWRKICLCNVWRNEEAAPARGQSGSLYAGKNPAAVWKLGEQPVKAMELPPDGQSLAEVSEEGTWRIVDTVNARCVL